jgi:lipoprotein-releasing system ATP-binding protein
MSKVQSPKSATEDSEADEPREANKAAIQGKGADIGHWTLDFGLKVSDVRKSFLSPDGERIEVLRGVSLSVNAGETVAIMGSSGTGKSTLLHLLGGLETPDHGSIVAGQFAIHSAGRSALANFRNHQVGVIFQFHHLLTDLTAAENVSVPLMIARVNRREASSRARRMLEEASLAGRSSHLVGQLSGGEQQRVAVCRALVNRPSFVLADEPTGNLDASIGDEIAHSLVNYAAKTKAIVIIATHNQRLADFCDRTLTLREGRLWEN